MNITIGADGSIKDVSVIRGTGTELDKEAVRVVSSSPKWAPGRQKGVPVNVSFMYPVMFSLPKPSSTNTASSNSESQIKEFNYAQANTGQNASTTSSIRASQQAGTTKQLAQNIPPKARQWTVEETLPASGTIRWSCKLYSDGTCTIRRGGKVDEGTWTYESFDKWRDLITVRYDGRHRLEVFYEFTDGGFVWLSKYY